MISYAQNFEDVILERVFKDKFDGFYVDIGAMHPLEHSITKWFYDKGWHGVNVEPNPVGYKLFLEQRNRDINIQCAICDFEGKIIFNAFSDENVDRGLGLSSIRPIDYSDYINIDNNKFIKIEVESITLDLLHEKYQIPQDYEFLKIDVEGAEYQILSKATFSQYRPKIIIIEATEPLSQSISYLNWEPFVLQANYTFVYFDGLNRFYLRNDLIELKELFSYPPCVFDNFVKYSEIKLQEQHNQLQEQHNQLQEQHNQLQERYISLLNSYSWRITAPLRWGLDMTKRVLSTTKQTAKAVFYSIPRKIVRTGIIVTGKMILKIPFIAKPIKFVLRRFPRLFERLDEMIKPQNSPSNYYQSYIGSNELSPRARQIYEDLKREIEKRKAERK